MKQKIFGCFLLIFAMIIALPILCFAEEVTEEVTEESVEFDGTSVVFSVDCSSGFFENSLNNTILSSSTWPTTPNGNDVTWARRRTEAVTSETLRTTLHDEMASQHSIRKYLGVASTVYNCHSYAWNSQDIGYNLYWIDWPEDYITDGSYTLVTGTPKPGDIVCYVDEDSPVGYQRIHSAILVKIVGNYNNLSGIIVQSKWGDYGLYEHYGNQSPYPATDSVEYYRLTGHSTHTFAYSANNSFMGYDAEDMDDCHAKYCTGCGVTIWEEHFESSYVSASTDIHNIYCACGHLMESEAHSYSVKNVGDDFKHAMQCACGHISSYIDHTFSYTETDASTHTKYCTVCYHEVIEPHFGEIINAVNNGTTHTLTCECSQTVTEAHSYNSCVPLDDELHKDVCICGSFITAEHNLVATSMDTAYHNVSCEECGYEAELTHTFGYTSLGSQTHRRTCTVCGDFYDEDHDLNMVVEYDAAEHTVKCACNYQITQGHIRMDYTATTHTGECRVCDHVSYTNETHTIVYSNNGDGTHTRACTGCEYSATELHDCVYTPIDIHGHDAVCQYCSYEVEDEAHSWDDGYDAEGNHYNYCMQCGYESDYVPMTAEMIAALSLEEQRALMQSIQTANSEFVLYLDAERGVLYQDGVCYLFYVPANVEVSVYLQPIDLVTTQPVYPLPEVTE